jgi:hypothetical protein
MLALNLCHRFRFVWAAVKDRPGRPRRVKAFYIQPVVADLPEQRAISCAVGELVSRLGEALVITQRERTQLYDLLKDEMLEEARIMMVSLQLTLTWGVQDTPRVADQRRDVILYVTANGSLPCLPLHGDRQLLESALETIGVEGPIDHRAKAGSLTAVVAYAREGATSAIVVPPDFPDAKARLLIGELRLPVIRTSGYRQENGPGLIIQSFKVAVLDGQRVDWEPIEY